MDVIQIVLIAVTAVLAVMFTWAVCRIRELKQQLYATREVEEISHARAVADGFYDNVLEADLTNDVLLGSNCKKLTSQLGLPEGTSFSSCIRTIVEKLVKQKYGAVYAKQFDRETLLDRYEKGERKFSFEFVERADLVHECWTRVTVCLYYSEAAKAVRLVSYVKNIQEEKEREFRLQEQANTDYLTGLYNKRAIEELICALLNEPVSQSVHHAMMIVDVDCFKQINDTIGHPGGDKVLALVAGSLKKQLDPGDIIGRIGGDEFLIFLRDTSSAEAVRKKMRNLAASMAGPQVHAQFGIGITLSIGAALCPEHADHFSDLFGAADSALYYVKEHGRNGAYLYQDADLCTEFQSESHNHSFERWRTR